ncbi:hypothetical protein CC80DRAFT_578074 [Byssothecium circinans]|uniref:Mid2 domain-containing protein n=1 Tax=Byssothecium circinans TaxID=147558 RepID=A0A6A5UK82_9PLEO|nr:hypothetical protein CC80DRAFT_578074 [Byssothecium circinans]
MSSATCYNPDGSAMRNKNAREIYIPCNTTAISNGHHSACCATGDLCLTNGLCANDGADGGNNYWRDGCTDRTFSDEACPRYCTGADIACCSYANSTFTADDALVYTTAKFATPKITSNTSVFFSSPTSTSTSISDGTSLSTSASGSSADSSSPPQATGSDPIGDGGSKLKVGLAVGLTVAGIVLISMSIAALVWRRKNTTKRAELGEYTGREQPTCHEVNGYEQFELQGQETRFELQAGEIGFELPQR